MNWWLKKHNFNVPPLFIWNENDNGLELNFLVFSKPPNSRNYQIFHLDQKSAMKIEIEKSSNQLICDRTVPAIPKSLFFNF